MSLRNLLVELQEQLHGSQTWAMSLERFLCMSSQRQRVMACFPCALDFWSATAELEKLLRKSFMWDCCSSTDKGKAATMFAEWDQLLVRLDVWQFMRQFAIGMTTDSHPLYSLFMKNPLHASLSGMFQMWRG